MWELCAGPPRNAAWAMGTESHRWGRAVCMVRSSSTREAAPRVQSGGTEQQRSGPGVTTLVAPRSGLRRGCTRTNPGELARNVLSMCAWVYVESMTCLYRPVPLLGCMVGRWCARWRLCTRRCPGQCMQAWERGNEPVLLGCSWRLGLGQHGLHTLGLRWRWPGDGPMLRAAGRRAAWAAPVGLR